MTAPALAYHTVSFTYAGRDAASLHEVSLTVAAGERVALVGANGAGKTTLLLLATGLIAPSAGRVEVEGITVTARSLREVRRRVSLAFADPDDQLFCATALDEVMFGLIHAGVSDTDARARALEALRAVDLEDRATREPLTMSLGEKKRLALATTLAAGSRIWLLDEPTGGLDPRARKHFLAHLAAVPWTMVLATHDLDAALSLGARVAIMDAGRLVAEGPADTILRDGALLEAHGLALPLSLGG
ncbi:MAG: ABC transporter ATP-binding protein [Deltaproteobacteria bacterium]